MRRPHGAAHLQHLHHRLLGGERRGGPPVPAAPARPHSQLLEPCGHRPPVCRLDAGCLGGPVAGSGASVPAPTARSSSQSGVRCTRLHATYGSRFPDAISTLKWHLRAGRALAPAREEVRESRIAVPETRVTLLLGQHLLLTGISVPPLRLPTVPVSSSQPCHPRSLLLSLSRQPQGATQHRDPSFGLRPVPARPFFLGTPDRLRRDPKSSVTEMGTPTAHGRRRHHCCRSSRRCAAERCSPLLAASRPRPRHHLVPSYRT